MNVIKVENLIKEFKDHCVLNNINLTFESGKIYGICGENGCGKTVLLKIICSLMSKTSGKVLFNDKDIDEQSNLFGIMFNGDGFFMDISGFDNLQLLASIQHRISNEEIKTMIEKVGLDPADKRPVKKYSLGMKQRLSIAQALMEDNKVLLLDEPTNALDEEGVQMIHTLLREEKAKGKIILLTSHNRYDIDSLADTVYRIKNGKVLHDEK